MVNPTQQRQMAAQQAAGGGAPQGILFRYFYAYSAQFSDLDSGETETAQVQIQADSDFQLQSITASVFLNTTGAIQLDTGLISELITVQLTDVGSGANLFSQAQPIQNIAGNAGLPFILPETKVLSANSQLGVQVTNGTSATDNLAVYLTFIGKKLFMAG